MAIRVDKFEGRAFRGLVDCPLPFGGRSVVVLGENGSGKSSIVDALEYFFSGHIERFEGTDDLSIQESAPHVKHKPADAEISLTFSPGAVKLTRTLATAPSVGGQLAAVLRVGESTAFILRRYQLLNFIATRPADRYDRLAELIGIDGLEKRELTLKSAKDDFQGKLEAAEREYKDSTEALAAALGIPDVSVAADVLSSINRLREKAELPPVATIPSALDEAQLEVVSGAAVQQTSSLERASRALAQLPNDVDVAHVSEAFGRLASAGAAYKTRVLDTQLSLLDLLRTGRAQLESFEPEACPLCERPIERVLLVASLDRRISELDRLSSEASQFRTEKTAAAAEAEILAGRLGDAARSLGEGAEAREAIRALSDAAAGIRALNERIRAADIPSLLPRRDDFEALSRESRLAVASTKTACETIVRASQSERAQARVSLLRALEALRRNNVGTANFVSAGKTSTLAAKVYDHFSAVRSAWVGSVYAQILPDLQKYYSRIHPHEPHKDVLLRFVPAKRKSTALEMTSFSRPGSDPRAFSSEAHLDTLGLCIFLAFYKQCSAGFPLLVLDDVLTTVDSQHRLKVAELLIDEFADRQLVLTTHDERWFEEIKAQVSVKGLDGQFTYLNIVGWSVDGGPDIRETRPTWDRVDGFLASGDKNAAGNEARRYLEWVLEEICKGSRAPVPYAHPRKPPLEDLFNGARTRIDDLVRDPAAQATFKAAFADVAATKFMANLLSHHNADSGGLSVAEVRAFADAVKTLHAAFSCAGCHALLIYSDQSNELYCPRTGCSSRTHYVTRK
jgi:energy-coupling factor transporter ATP-binding protein EcfA2